MSETLYTVGNVTVDDLVFSDGRTCMNVPGGNSVYSALGARVWSAPTGVVSVSGPEYPFATLEALGITLDHLRRTMPSTLRNWGLYEENGTRQFIFRGQHVRWEDYSPVPADLPDEVGGHYHLAPLPFSHQASLVAALRERGTDTITLDPDDRQLAVIASERIQTLLVQVDAFLPSRQDVAVLFPSLSPQAALLALRERYPDTPVIAVKLGQDGVILHAHTTSSIVRVPAYHADAVDPTGAGDAFCGGFLYGYATTRDPVEAVLAGAVSASFAVERIGIDGLRAATAAEAERRLAHLRAAI